MRKGEGKLLSGALKSTYIQSSFAIILGIGHIAFWL